MVAPVASIKFAVQTPEFNERLRVLNEILERGVSPDGQSAEFLLWRLDTADASTQVLHQTLDWFYERKLWSAFEELCRKGLSESRWVTILGKDEHLDLSIRLAEALFFDPSKRPEALGLMTAVREVDIHRAGRCTFLESWISKDLDAAEWILALALELNNDDLVASAYRALFATLSPIETKEEWYEKATMWAVSKERHDLLVELLTLALELKDSLDPWLLLDWAAPFVQGLSADAQFWFWLDDRILTVEPRERRHRWILLRAEQLLKRNVTDPELWNVLHRDESLLTSEARGVELALKSALARDARKDMLVLIERAIDSEAQGALTWDAWYEQALVRSVEDDWLRVCSRALSLDSNLSPEVYANGLILHRTESCFRRNVRWYGNSLSNQSWMRMNYLCSLRGCLELKTCLSRSGCGHFERVSMPAWTTMPCLNVWLSCFVMLAATKALLKRCLFAGGPPRTSRIPVYWQPDSNLRLFGA